MSNELASEVCEEILEERIEEESKVFSQLIYNKKYPEALEYLEAKEKEQE